MIDRLPMTCEIELQPGEKLELPEAFANRVGPGRWIISVQASTMSGPMRDHSAFLHSYFPGDEGLYDDCATG